MPSPNPPPTFVTERDPSARNWLAKYRYVARILGVEKFHGWQEEYLAGISQRGPDGERSFSTTVLNLGRQGGKSHVIPTVAFTDALDGKKVGITQQERSKITERWLEWIGRWDQNAPPELKGRARRQAGREVWELPGRGSVRPLTPNGTHVRGFDLDTILADEAAYIPRAFFEAAAYCLATKPDMAFHYLCTAGDRGDPKSVHFDEQVKAAKAGESGYYGMVYEGGRGDDWGSRAVWDRLIPTIGCTDPQGVTYKFVEGEYAKHRRLGTLEVFAREMLGVWTEPPQALSLDIGRWRALEDPECRAGRGSVVAIDAGRNLQRAAIVAAKATDDGRRVTLEVVEVRDGAEWVPRRMVELRRKHPGRIDRVVIDKRTAAGAYIPELKREGFRVEAIDTAEFTAYWSKFMNLVEQGPDVFRHRPNASLDAAVETGKVRPIGDAWSWDRKADDSGCVLVAATMAAGRAAAKPTTGGIL